MPEHKRKISTRLIIKGSLIEDTYSVFRQWDLDATFRDNLQKVRATNSIGAKSERWLNEVLKTVASRFSETDNFAPLVVLAKGGFPIEEWKACLLWHIGGSDELYYRFCTEWLCDEFLSGCYQISTFDVMPLVHKFTNDRPGGSLTENTALRVASGLLKMACEFGLLEGSVKKKFATYHIPQEAFVYVLQGLSGEGMSTSKILSSRDWSLFLMGRDDVERELLRLHQYKILEYQVAGSISSLKLPCGSLLEYARKLVA